MKKINEDISSLGIPMHMLLQMAGIQAEPSQEAEQQVMQPGEENCPFDQFASVDCDSDEGSMTFDVPSANIVSADVDFGDCGFGVLGEDESFGGEDDTPNYGEFETHQIDPRDELIGNISLLPNAPDNLDMLYGRSLEQLQRMYDRMSGNSESNYVAPQKQKSLSNFGESLSESIGDGERTPVGDLVGQFNDETLEQPYRAVLFLMDGKPVIQVEEYFEEYGEWKGTPGRWYLSTLADGSIGDTIAIDAGQGWGISHGMREAIQKAQEMTGGITESPDYLQMSTERDSDDDGIPDYGTFEPHDTDPRDQLIGDISMLPNAPEDLSILYDRSLEQLQRMYARMTGSPESNYVPPQKQKSLSDSGEFDESVSCAGGTGVLGEDDDMCMNNPDYQFYIVSPEGKILSGWEYKEDAKESLSDLPPELRTGAKGVAKVTLGRMGINPDDANSWHTTTESVYEDETDDDDISAQFGEFEPHDTDPRDELIGKISLLPNAPDNLDMLYGRSVEQLQRMYDRMSGNSESNYVAPQKQKSLTDFDEDISYMRRMAGISEDRKIDRSVDPDDLTSDEDYENSVIDAIDTYRDDQRDPRKQPHVSMGNYDSDPVLRNDDKVAGRDHIGNYIDTGYRHTHVPLAAYGTRKDHEMPDPSKVGSLGKDAKLAFREEMDKMRRMAGISESHGQPGFDDADRSRYNMGQDASIAELCWHAPEFDANPLNREMGKTAPTKVRRGVANEEVDIIRAKLEESFAKFNADFANEEVEVDEASRTKVDKLAKDMRTKGEQRRKDRDSTICNVQAPAKKKETVVAESKKFTRR